MNTYIFNGFIIIIIFIIIQLGVIITLINVRNNKDDKDIGIVLGKNIDCQASWNHMTAKNILLQKDPACYDINISNYVITQEPVGEGTKCLFSAPTTVSFNTSEDVTGKEIDSFNEAYTAGAIYMCKTPTATPPTSCKHISPTGTTTGKDNLFFSWLTGPKSPLSSKIQPC